MFASLSEMNFFATANLITVFRDTDIAGQVITGGLALFSLFAWTIMFGKNFELKRLRLLNLAFQHRLREQREIFDLPESLKPMRPIPYADLFADAIEAYCRAAARRREKGVDSARGRLDRPAHALQRA